MNDSTITIPKNRKKQLLLFSGCMLFVIGSYYMMTIDTESQKYPLYYRKFIGIIGGLFFGSGAIAFLWDILKNEPGLVIDQKGILNNSNLNSGYFVSWEEIEDMSISTISRKQKCIIINVVNHEKIYDQVNWLKRLLLKGTARFYQSPVFITDSILNESLDEVLKKLRKQRNSFHRNN